MNLTVAAALLGSYLSQYIPPDGWWAPAMLGLAYPYLLVANLMFVVAWLMIRPSHSLFSLLTILLGWGTLARFVQLSGRETKQSGISIVSYNVKNFTGRGKNPSRELADVIKGFLQQNEPDIICLQEVKLRTKNVFNLEEALSQFTRIKHYQYARAASTMGSVTLTRFPIVNMEEIRFENSDNIAICTDVVIKKDTFRIFNIHLQSYRIDPDRYDIITSPGFTREKDFREFRELARKYRSAVEMRALQARIIKRKVEESPHPVILCGDFNDTPLSYAYRKTRGKLHDAFVGSGSGIGQTYVGKMPSFRIDYILHSKNLKSYNFKIHEIPYSDHLPISCILMVRQ